MTLPKWQHDLLDLIGGDPFDRVGARDHLGRPLVDGDPHRRPSTAAKALDNQTNLVDWKAGKVLIGTALSPMIHPEIVALHKLGEEDPEYRGRLRRLVETSMDASGANDARERGSLIHALTEFIDGRPLPDDQATVELLNRAIADPDLSHALTSYRTESRRLGFTFRPDLIEVSVVNDERRLAGTVDRIPQGADGRYYVWDLKTGKTSSVPFQWLSWLLQLSAYANADCIYDPASGQRSPLPTPFNREIGYICHVGSDTGITTVYRLDLGEAASHAYELAGMVEQARGRAGSYVTKATDPLTAADKNLGAMTTIKGWIGVLDAVDGALPYLSDLWQAAKLPRPDDLTPEQHPAALEIINQTKLMMATEAATEQSTAERCDELPSDLADGVYATAAGIFNSSWDDDPVTDRTGWVFASLLDKAELAWEQRRAALEAVDYGGEDPTPRGWTKKRTRVVVATNNGLAAIAADMGAAMVEAETEGETPDDDERALIRRRVVTRLVQTAVGSQKASVVREAGRTAARWLEVSNSPQSAKSVYENEVLAALVIGRIAELDLP